MIRYRPISIVLTAAAGVDAVELTWTNLSSVDASVTYDIYRGMSPSYLSHIASTIGVTYADTPPDDEHVWYYRVVARASGVALSSNLVYGTLTGPEWLTWGDTDIHPFLEGIGASSLKRFAELT